MFHNRFFRFLKGIICNKYFVILVISFVLYVLSWFLWLGNFRNEYTFINNKKVFVYDYFNGIVFDKLARNSELVDAMVLLKFFQAFYFPLELIMNNFGCQNIRGFYRLNAEILKDFNSLSEVQKLAGYAKLNEFHGSIAIYNDNEEFEARYTREQRNKVDTHQQIIQSWSVFGQYLGIKDNILREEYYYNLNKNIDSMWFNYSEYKILLFEAKKFSKWFNNLNITTSNSNFDKEFVEKYWEYIKLIEDGKEESKYNFR